MPNVIYGLHEAGLDELRYVGKTCDPARRLKEHKNACVSFYNKDLCSWISSAGENLRLLVLEESPEDWRTAELAWIERLRRENYKLFNLAKGGDGRPQGTMMSLETRARMSRGLRKRWARPEYRVRVSAALKGRVVSTETKVKISIAKTGKKRSSFSAEWKAKMSASHKGKAHSLETRARLSVAHKERRRRLLISELQDMAPLSYDALMLTPHGESQERGERMISRALKLVTVFAVMFALSLCLAAPALAGDEPRVSIYAGYSATRLKPVLKDATAPQGFEIAASLRIAGQLAVKADFTNLNAPGNARILVFGPEIRTGKKIQWFGHAMVGFVKSSNTTGATAKLGRIKVKDADVAAVVGGGLDIKPAKWIAFRLVQADYLRAAVAGTGAKNQFRVGAGVVFGF